MHRQSSSSRVVDIPQTSQPSSLFSPRRKMEEPTDLPIYYRNSTFSKREISTNKLAKRMIHLIPIVVLLCLFILWWFTYPVSLERSNGRIAAARLLKTHSTMFLDITFPPNSSDSEMQMVGNVSIAR